MDCREAQRRLKELASPDTDSDLCRHAADCPACARLLESAALLNHAFEQARMECSNEAFPSLADTRRAVEQRMTERHWTGWQRISDFWNFGTRSARWGLSAGVALAALAFITLVPFDYQKTVGYEVAFAGVDPELAKHEDRLTALLAAVGAEHASVSWLGCDSTCSLRVSDMPGRKQCQLLAGALMQLCKVKVLESGARVCEIESGPLLAVALDRVRATDPGNVSEAECLELLKSCMNGGAVCTVSNCDSALAAACKTLCPGGPAACALMNDSSAAHCMPQTCGEYRSGSNMCGAGACALGVADGSHLIESGEGAAKAVQPTQIGLAQNHPNPFNPVTEIAFTLPTAMEVRLEIYNSLGRKVRTLARGTRPAGAHTVIWDARSDDGQSVPSGTYLYRLTAGDRVESKTMTLLK